MNHACIQSFESVAHHLTICGFSAGYTYSDLTPTFFQKSPERRGHAMRMSLTDRDVFSSPMSRTAYGISAQ